MVSCQHPTCDREGCAFHHSLNFSNNVSVFKCTYTSTPCNLLPLPFQTFLLKEDVRGGDGDYLTVHASYVSQSFSLFLLKFLLLLLWWISIAWNRLKTEGPVTFTTSTLCTYFSHLHLCNWMHSHSVVLYLQIHCIYWESFIENFCSAPELCTE